MQTNWALWFSINLRKGKFTRTFEIPIKLYSVEPWVNTLISYVEAAKRRTIACEKDCSRSYGKCREKNLIILSLGDLRGERELWTMSSLLPIKDWKEEVALRLFRDIEKRECFTREKPHFRFDLFILIAELKHNSYLFLNIFQINAHLIISISFFLSKKELSSYKTSNFYWYLIICYAFLFNYLIA